MDFNKYIGLPYKQNGRTETGVDCWGLARLVYAQELGIELPSYADLYQGSWDEQVTKLIEHSKDGWQQVQDPQPGDLCVFNIYGEPAHVGVYVGNGKFLHSREGLDTVIDTVNSSQWRKRLDGYFRYKPESAVQVSGTPHPLRVMRISDWTVAGTTVQQAVNFLQKKYAVSDYLTNRLVVMLDGVPVPASEWSTTTIKEGQQLTYRSLAEGRQGLRTLLLIAVVAFAAFAAAPIAAGGLGWGTAVGALGIGPTAGGVLVSSAITMAGTALINAIAPVRMPQQNDPGQPNQLNLFNGSSNQINRMGAIPVVLGKVRYTGLLGATPYIETLTDTNIMNMIIVWGFGPLQVSDINVGANDLLKYYFEDLPLDVARPVTLYGSYSETQAEISRFNELYPTDVQQIFATSGELTNNPQDGNPWRETTFTQQATALDIALTFPEGMRKIQRNNGDISEATCSVEIQVAPVSGSFTDTPSLQAGGGNTSVAAYSKTLQGASIAGGPVAEAYLEPQYLYRWYVICIGPGGNITEFAGAATDSLLAEPSAQLLQIYQQSNLSSLLGVNSSITRLPVIPPGYKRLYTVCLQGGVGLLPAQTINHLASSGASYTGLVLTYTNQTAYAYDQGYIQTGDAVINITGGTYIVGSSPTAGEPIIETIFASSTTSLTGVVKPTGPSTWSEFLTNNAVWPSAGGNTATLTKNVTFTYTGFYNFECAVDGTLKVKLGTETLLDLPQNSAGGTASISKYIEAGTYLVTLEATSTSTTKALALKITYTFNGGENVTTGPKTIVTFGTPQNFYKRKDPFNWVYRLRGLPRNTYKVRVRRADVEVPDDENQPHKVYSKCALYAASCYDNTVPTQNPPRSRIAKTAIKVQSTSKANGQVDGINALVQTQTFDWDRTLGDWVFRATNNPASLFLYVLTHPANAYRIANINDPANPAQEIQQLLSKVDINKIIEWHNFCNPVTPTANNPKLTFNSVITSTTSVMDILRDICAAGKASPIYIDGKWSVIIDKPRDHVVQHFTPHNSWGFESTKVLPRLPHAFRVSIQDEEDGYQTRELYVYNYGYSQLGTEPNKKAAEIFEELQLPGVTNVQQATHLARWHMAQLKLRPEVYTLNVDFEYLVCNRGDLVRVSHDVPLWGTGSGRVKSFVTATKTITLTEEVYLESSKQYRILIRTNNITSTPGSGSVYKTIVVPSTGYYSTITVVESIGTTEIAEDNLYMIGELNKETQELIVLSVEPTSNITARLTLADYSPQIYTTDLANDLLVYNPNSTLPSSGILENTIITSPTIIQVTSDPETRQEISPGVFQTTALLTFSNAQGLGAQATHVQLELVLADEQFSSTSPGVIHIVNKEAGNYTFTGITTGLIYKVRVRYTNSTGSVFGPWSEPFIFVAQNKLSSTAPSVTLTAPTQVFIKLKNSNSFNINSITLTANIANIVNPTYKWYVDTVLQVGAITSAFTINSFTSGTSKVIRCEVLIGTTVLNYDEMTIFSLQEGSDTLMAGLVNETQTISADNLGNVLSGQLPLSSQMIVVRGNEVLVSGITFSKVTETGMTSTINSSTGIISITAISAGIQATATYRVTIGTTTLDKKLTINIVRNGSNGDSGQPGTPGALGIVTRIAYIKVSQVIGSPNYASSTTENPANVNNPITTPSVTGSTWSLSTPAASVGDIIWYSYGRYNPNSFASQGLSAYQTQWSTPIASSIFQDIKSDNWQYTDIFGQNQFGAPSDVAFLQVFNPTGSGGVQKGYYIEKAQGAFYGTDVYMQGQVIAKGNNGAFAQEWNIGGLTLYTSSGFTGLGVGGINNTSTNVIKVGSAGYVPRIWNNLVANPYSVWSVGLFGRGEGDISGGVNNKKGVGVIGVGDAVGVYATNIIPQNWSSSTVYRSGDIVAYNSVYYRRLVTQTSASATIPPNDTNWVQTALGVPLWVKAATNNETAAIFDGTVTFNGSVALTGGVSTNLSVTGNILATGNVTAYNTSDIMYKTNITRITNALDSIRQLGGYSYEMTEEYLKKVEYEKYPELIKKKDVGILAQEVLKVVPSAVAKLEDGTLGVNYTKLIPLLLEAILELDRRTKNADS